MKLVASTKNQSSLTPPLSSVLDPQNNKEKKKGKPKNKLGRAARRRKAKARAINQAFLAILRGDVQKSLVPPTCCDGNGGECANTESPQAANGGTPPQDRNRSLPGALVRRYEVSYGCGEVPKDEKGEVNRSKIPSDYWREEDKRMLVSQLGFLPGNGICIASRVTDLQSKFPCLYQLLLRSVAGDGETEDEKGGARDRLRSSPESPIVLKLYPLAIRDVYSGGKADGRKFKARKRGHSHLSPTDGNGGSAQEDEQDAKKISLEANGTSINKMKPSESAKTVGVRKNTEDACKEASTTIEPFPTMYWLTHPHLRILISQLEIGSTHNVRLLEERLQSCPNYLKSMERAHVSYGTNRWELLTNKDMTDIVSRRHWEGALGNERGVAGIRKHNTIKCLHAHAAHFLAQNSSWIGCAATETVGESENIVGKWAVEAMEEMLKNGVWKD